MCYSLRTSIISYSIGLISALVAFMTRQPVLGTLIFAYSQMQLSELLIWRGIDTNNIRLNKIGTQWGKYLLATHNIAIGIGIILAVIFIRKKPLTLWDSIPLILGSIFFVVIVLGIYLPRKYPDVTYQQDPSCKDPSCQTQGNRLKWPYPHGWYFWGLMLSLGILFFWIKPQGTKIWLSTMFISTLIGVALLRPKVTGSIWCFSAAILAPLLVGVNYLIIRNKSNLAILT